MNTRTVPHRIIDLPLGGGTTLRVALTRYSTVRRVAITGKKNLRRKRRGFRAKPPSKPPVLPASVLPELVAALEALR